MTHYNALKQFFKSVNCGVGLLFLCCIGISLPIYATWIAVQFFDKSIKAYDAIHFYVYFVTFLIVLSLAARINQKVLTIHKIIFVADTCAAAYMIMSFYDKTFVKLGE